MAQAAHAANTLPGHAWLQMNPIQTVPHPHGNTIQPPGQASDTSYPLVDVMRGIAALMVLTYHVIAVTGWQTFPDTWWSAP